MHVRRTLRCCVSNRRTLLPLAATLFSIVWFLLPQKAPTGPVSRFAIGAAGPQSDQQPGSSSSTIRSTTRAVKTNQTGAIVVHSATYYRHSKIYGDNSVILLINAHDQVPVDRLKLFATSSNATDSHRETAALRKGYGAEAPCRWTIFFAVFHTVQEPTQLQLASSGGGPPQETEILLRNAYEAKGGGRGGVQVAVCYSPQFYWEHWQLLVTTVEVYRHYGMALQVLYVQSALKQLLDLLETYSGVVEVEKWSPIELDEDGKRLVGFDPNGDLNWRNQATASNDCLFKYRAAFDYLLFVDLDDVLIPILGKTYIDELNVLASMLPDAAAFLYSRFNSRLKADPSNFSLYQTLSSIYLELDALPAKFVANSSRVEIVWFHDVTIKLPNTREVRLDDWEAGQLVHFRYWRSPNTSFAMKEHARELPHALFNFHGVANQKVLRQIDAKFEAHRQKHSEVFAKLPRRQYYFAEFTRCYQRFRTLRLNVCHGPKLCSIGQVPDLQCSVARRHFRLQSPTDNAQQQQLAIFTAKEATFEQVNNGCIL